MKVWIICCLSKRFQQHFTIFGCVPCYIHTFVVVCWLLQNQLGRNNYSRNTIKSFKRFGFRSGRTFVFCLFVFVALRPKSTAMVIAGRSVHLTTLFSWASLNKQLTSNRAHTFACNWQQPFMNDSAEGRRMTVEIISWSISTKVWDRAGIELATPGSAVSFASVTRHVTDGRLLVLIWIQTVFKAYQQTTKVTASKERYNARF